MTKAAELAKMGEVLTNSQIGGRRNMVINGAMQVAQRGTSQTGITSNGYHTVDRVRLLVSSAGTYTASQVADSPSGQGFYFSYKLDCTTSDTYSGSGDNLHIRMGSLEQQDCLKFNYGGSSAEKLTLSFWAKFSYADTFNIALVNHVAQRSNFKPFTISSADTWQKIIITYDGDTNSGDGFANSTALGLSVDLWLGGGSNFSGGSATSGVWDERSNNNTSLAAASTKFGTSTDHELFITGIQLELGSAATPFEHRSFGEELNLCRRYYFKTFPQGVTPVAGHADHIYYHLEDYTSGYSHISTSYPVEMRAEPTVVIYTSSASSNGTGRVTTYDGSWGNSLATLVNSSTANFSNHQVDATTGVKLVQYNLTADAEL